MRSFFNYIDFYSQKLSFLLVFCYDLKLLARSTVMKHYVFRFYYFVSFSPRDLNGVLDDDIGDTKISRAEYEVQMAALRA